jgi:hypothetical protein
MILGVPFFIGENKTRIINIGIMDAEQVAKDVCETGQLQSFQ